MTLFQVFEFYATYIEALIGLLIITKAIDVAAIKWKNTLIASNLIAMIIWWLNQYQLFSVMTSVISVIGLTLSIFVIYRTNIIETLFFSIVYMVLLYIIDFLSISLLGVFFQAEQIAQNLTKSFSQTRIMLLILSKGILCILYIILIRKHLTKLDIKSFNSKFSVFLLSVIVFILIKITYRNANISIVISWTLLLMLIIMGIYMLAKYSFFMYKQKELELAMKKNDIMFKNYNLMIQNFQNNRLFYHDLQNQYLIIESYLKSENYLKAKAYVETLKNSTAFVLLEKRTGIEGLDILLSCKKREATAAKIQTIIIADLINLHIDEHDIISLIGNTFDNAIEACHKVDGKKWIQITIRNINGMTFIKISNSYKDSPQLEDNRLISKKKGKSLHGLGILSMQTIVEKYQGKMSINYKDGIFTVLFSFFN